MKLYHAAPRQILHRITFRYGCAPLLRKIGMLAVVCNIFLLQNAAAQFGEATKKAHTLLIISSDSAEKTLQGLKLETAFTSAQQCHTYVNGLPLLLSAKGYPAASADSVWATADSTFVKLFLGKKYEWASISVSGIDKKALAASGFIENDFTNQAFNIGLLEKVQQRLLTYYENSGYPFARIYMDSITLEADKLKGVLKTDPGYVYRIDSIRVMGNIKISKYFLQHYLGIANGSLYNKARLEQANQRLLELPYLQQEYPANLTMLGAGAIFNLYLAPKKSSQFNFLLGFLPAANEAQKFQLTADVNLNLKNQFGNGETILFNWQQLQQKSPRLNLGYQQPYIFKSKFGIDFLFDLFKKDSTFLQVNGQLGIVYNASVYQTVKIFAQWQNSFLLAGGADTSLVKLTKSLPANIDVNATSFGLDYNHIKTDYRLNPRKGNEVKLTALAGLKKIKQNNDILAIKDPLFSYKSLYDSLNSKSYQLRVKLYAAHYFPSGKQGTLKVARQCSLVQQPRYFPQRAFPDRRLPAVAGL